MLSWQTILQTINPYLVLAVTWIVGQRILISWEIRKKRQELDIAAATQFQQLYGEMKEIARLWRISTKPQNQDIPKPTEIRWQLLVRSTAVEGKFEAVVIKLASERILSDSQIRTLGLFRQACQDLRHSIQEDISLPSFRYGGGYTKFNALATEITCLLGSNQTNEIPTFQMAQVSLASISEIGSKHWKQEIEEEESRLQIKKEN